MEQVEQVGKTKTTQVSFKSNFEKKRKSQREKE
jgi:hypothetical protein